MRLVRFEDESGGFAVDLHPLITVISGLPPHVRERLIQGLAALPRGADPGGRGSLEVHGVYLDLNRESLELLELNQDLDVILRATDLPGAEHAAEEAPEEETISDYSSEADDEELRAARRVVNEQEETYQQAVRALEAVRAELARIESEQESLNQQLVDARAGLDSFAVAGLKLAREELDEILARVASEAHESHETPADPAGTAGEGVSGAQDDGPEATTEERPDTTERRAEIESRLSVLIEESDRLRRSVRSLEAIDTTPVRAAYDAFGEAGEAHEDVSSPEARLLIEAWEALHERQAALDARRGGTSEIELRRDLARQALVEAERDLRTPRLDPALVEQLESVHDEIFELEGRTSRFGGGKIRRRLDALRRTEAELLEQLGFDGWSSYIMGITTTAEDPARLRAFEAARSEYERVAAEAERQASTPALPDPEVERVAAERTRLRVATTELLGEPAGDDPIAQLREHRPEGATPHTSVDVEGSAQRLRDALVATGAELPERDLAPDEVKSLAAGWLETMEGLAARIAAVNEQRDEIEGEINELALELEGLADGEPPLPGLADASAAPRRRRRHVTEDAPATEAAGAPAAPAAPPVERIPGEPAEVLEARERVAEGEARVAAHESSVEVIAVVEARLDELTELARNGATVLAEQEPRVAAALEQRVAARNRLRRAENARSAAESSKWENRHSSGGGSDYVGGSAGAEAVEWYVLARLAQQRSVSFVGSVPLVIDDAFVNWPMEALGDVFARLERMGEVIQIVYLTDDPDVGSWARSLGSDRALVLDMRVSA